MKWCGGKSAVFLFDKHHIYSSRPEHGNDNDDSDTQFFAKMICLVFCKPGGSVDLGIALHQALYNIHLPGRLIFVEDRQRLF